MQPTTPLAIALDKAGFRRTEQRRVIGELIAARAGHFTAADLALELIGFAALSTLHMPPACNARIS